MVRAVLFSLLAAGGVLAQPVIQQGPVADAITYSSARLNWITDVDSDSVIRYGIDSLNVETISTERGKIHSWYISGLAPNTTYRYQVCSKLETGEACKDGTLTTLAAENTPQVPEPPRQYVDTKLPEGAYGEPFIIDQQCSNLPATLQSLGALEGDLSYEVRIAPGTKCAGMWIFPNRPKHRGWVVVTTTGTLPSPGTRVQPEDTAQMATMITNGLPGQMLSTASFPTTCTPKTVIWGRNTTDMGLFGCMPGRGNSTTTKPVTGLTADGKVVVTVSGHGYSSGDLVRLADTKTGADGTWRITVIDENAFALDGARATRAYADGGTATRNDAWAQVPYRSGTELPTDCNPNDFFFKTDTEPVNGVYWCTSQNTWTHVRPGHYVTASTIAAIQFAEWASRYRFIGIEVTHIPVPNPPPPEWSDGRQGNFGSLVTTNATNDRIIFDRCDVHGLDYPGRVGRGFYLNGSNVAVIDSRVHKINRWTSENGYAAEATAVDISVGPGPGTLENNLLEAIGITVFFPNPDLNIVPAADYVIRRNYFSHPEAYMPGSPKNWSGKNYNNRQVLEIKAGQRMLIEGNIFDGNWSDITQGAMILLTPRRYEAAAKRIASVENGILKVPSTAATNPYTPGLLVSLQNTGTSLDGIWEIAEVLNSTTYRLANIPAGTATTGTVIAVTSHMAITDIDVRNNIFRNGPNLLWITGHDSAPTTKTTQRIRFHNNLVVGMDVRSSNEGGRVSPIGVNKDGRSGVGIYAASGMEDLIVTRNTIFDFKGRAPSFMQFDVGRNVHSGLLVTDNIFTASKALITSINGANQGKAALDFGWKQQPVPKWTFRNNVLCCDISVKTPEENHWPNNIAEIEFLNPLLGALQLNAGGKFSVAATTGGTVGVDFDALESSIGQPLLNLLPLITNNEGQQQKQRAPRR